MRVLVAGSTGFVGRRLCPALAAAGHRPRAMTRRPAAYRGAGEPVYGDVEDAGSLRAALAGSEVAYYLVHSLGQPDFARRDAEAALGFARAAADAGVARIVYLGGLGADSPDLSEHLRSRREVEGLLGSAGVPVTALRAAIVVGHGGASWELARQLADRLPAVVAPTCIDVLTQPIALEDVVRYLVEVLAVPQTLGGAFDVGGRDVLTYREMISRIAAVHGRRLAVLPLPLLSQLLALPLSKLWLTLALWLLTDVDAATSQALLRSMCDETVMRDDRIRRLVRFEPKSYRDAMLDALRDRAEESEAA